MTCPPKLLSLKWRLCVFTLYIVFTCWLSCESFVLPKTNQLISPTNKKLIDFIPAATGKTITHTRFSVQSPAPATKSFAQFTRLDGAATAAAATAAALASSASSSAVINRAAIKSISKLLSTCGLGIWAGKAGVLDQTALGVLSKLIFNVFQPCLLLVNVASTVAQLKASGGGAPIYILPIAAGFQILVGYIVGKIVSLLMYGKNDSGEGAKQLLACTAFGNSGPLPLVFTDGLFRSHPDTSLLPRSVAYISLYLLGWSPLFWIFAPAVLKEENPNAASTSKSEKRKELVRRVFSPPVVASLIGMVIGLVPALQKVIISNNGLLNPIFEAMRTLGAAYLPTVLLVLAGSLSPPPSSSPATTAPTNASGVSQNDQIDAQFVMKALSVYAARFALMPIVAFSLYKMACLSIPGVKAFFDKDPLLLMILLLEASMPSAQNTTVILQLQGNKGAATRLARTLMAVYVLGVPALSYWLIRILSLTGLAA